MLHFISVFYSLERKHEMGAHSFCVHDLRLFFLQPTDLICMFLFIAIMEEN